MRVLVTGGAGYVGSHVVQALLETGHHPVVYDNLSTGHRNAVRDAELIVGDVADRELLAKVLTERRFDGCVHLAAYSLVGESVKNPSKYFANNTVGGIGLADALVAADVPWLVLSSTAAVYGEPESIPIVESNRKMPTNPYGESKLALERVLDWYDSAYGFRHMALRYFNAAGAHPSGMIGEDHNPETHLIPIVLQVAQGKREALSVYGTDYPTFDGTAIRDYVHVCDLAAAHVAGIEALGTGAVSDSFNLGTQQGYSVLEIVEAARKVTGHSIPVLAAERRGGDPAVLVASARKAKEELGWAPVRTLEEIVESAWRWHQTHPNGY